MTNTTAVPDLPAAILALKPGLVSPPGDDLDYMRKARFQDGIEAAARLVTASITTQPAPSGDAVEVLREALDKLIDVAEACDSWQSFPRAAINEANAALAITDDLVEAASGKDTDWHEACFAGTVIYAGEMNKRGLTIATKH